MRKTVTEEMKVHDEWHKEAEGVTLDKLPEFLRKLTEDYEHDYGTIVHAMTAGAVATITAMNKTDQGGITGFQAGCIMWQFLKEFNGKDGPMRLVEYGDMLYPQYEDRFQKTISKETLEHLREKAQQLIKGSENSETVSPVVLKHWKKIADGGIPFGYGIEEKNK